MELELTLRFAPFLHFFTRVEGAGYFRIALVLFRNPVPGTFSPAGLIIHLQLQPICWQIFGIRFVILTNKFLTHDRNNVIYLMLTTLWLKSSLKKLGALQKIL